MDKSRMNDFLLLHQTNPTSKNRKYELIVLHLKSGLMWTNIAGSDPMSSRYDCVRWELKDIYEVELRKTEEERGLDNKQKFETCRII